MVFQSYALYPHKSACENIEFPLKIRGVARADRGAAGPTGRRRLARSHARCLDRKPGQLVGRPAPARRPGACDRSPAGRCSCMDEPLSNLDAKLRGETRAELIDLHQRLGATILYVTHDQVEAMTMGTRVAVMNGRRPPAGRHAAGRLRPPGQHLRRPVRRHAADEPVPAAHARGRRRGRRRPARAPDARHRRRALRVTRPPGRGARSRAPRELRARRRHGRDRRASRRRWRCPARGPTCASAPPPPTGTDFDPATGTGWTREPSRLARTRCWRC